MPVQDVNETYLWSRLEPLLDYLHEWERQKVQEALYLAYDAHEGQFRKSGEKFISHPVEVTHILAELRMDYESLIAGLLHDTVEDTAVVTFDEIEHWFGPAVRKIVEGETKFSKLPKLKESVDAAAASGSVGRVQDVKALDLQQLFLAMTEEVRIIVVKLADRLHNMRTLHSLPPEKRAKIAQETLCVFAPLARLLGLYDLKEELEETSFMYAAPEEYAALKRRLDQLARDQEDLVLNAKSALEDTLRSDPHLASQVVGFSLRVRQKSVYSIYSKLVDTRTLLPALKRGAAKAVRDVAQLQLVLHTANEAGVFGDGVAGADPQICYHCLGLVHSKFTPIPGAVKDYIATPKPNGYRSLHTTVLPVGLGTTGDTLIPLELQIRTARMHKLADYGIAAENWLHSPRLLANLASSQDDGSSPSTHAPSPFPFPPASSSHVGGNGASGNGNGANGAPAPQASDSPARGQAKGARQLRSMLTDAQVAAGMGAYHLPPDAGWQSLTRASMDRRVNWLTAIREWQEEFLGSLSAREFVDCVTDDLLGQGVFVFTPAGDILRLPKGATVVDFAYHVHTDLGNQMVAAKVNGKVVQADHVLTNASVVEVMRYDGPPTAATVRRHRHWLQGAKTKSTKHKLAKFLKDHAALLGDAEGGDSDTASVSGRSHESSSGPAGLNGNGLCPSLVRSNMTWLIVECCDRPGLLAEVAGVIAAREHNIAAHSGTSDNNKDTFLMSYLLETLNAEAAPALCADLDAIPAVRSWSLGCGLPPACSRGESGHGLET